MLLLYISLAFMLLCAGLLLTFFSVNNKWIIFMFLLLVSSSLYFYISDQPGLWNWYSNGKQHYALLQQVEDLGGIDGMITRVKQKLARDPKDAEGWKVLGKLYLAKGDKVNAEKAFKRAKLEPK